MGMIELWATLTLMVLIYMSTWFVVSVALKRSDVADTAWGLGFVIVAWGAYMLADTPSGVALAINILVTIWGLRLSTHIFLRNRHKTEDRRYAEMRAKWGKGVFIRTYTNVFLAQGLLLLLISTPVILANGLTQSTGAWQYFGFVIWTVGFFFESIGDWQLTRFIQNPINKGKIMTTGLWRYTRHPNYFGEVTQWWGIFILSLSGLSATAGIIGPAVITVLILKISGIPLLERKMQDNPAFAAYAAKTSMFVPRPPRSDHPQQG